MAVALGFVAALYARYMMSLPGNGGANDFTYYWLAARAIIEGANPYTAVAVGGEYHLNAGFLYPLPAALLMVPLAALLSPVAAASVFVGASTSLLAWAIARSNSAQLAMFGGIPFFWAVSSGQLITLVTTGAVIPAVAWLSLLKPNIALAVFAYRPTRWIFLGGAVLLIVSLLIQPDWIPEWLAVVKAHSAGNYKAPIMLFGGPLLLASVLRWRRPEARLLLVMSCVPQSLLFYDQLILGLVPKTRNESMILVICGFLGYMVSSWSVTSDATPASASAVYGPAILVSLYLPCVIMILRRPNATVTVEP